MTPDPLKSEAYWKSRVRNDRNALSWIWDVVKDTDGARGKLAQVRGVLVRWQQEEHRIEEQFREPDGPQAPAGVPALEGFAGMGDGPQEPPTFIKAQGRLEL